MKKTLYFVGIAVLLTAAGCGYQNKVSGYYDFETECMGSNGDGSTTLKAWGTGDDQSTAEIRAKKNALHSLIFDGIRKGKDGCDTKPILVEVNAEEKYKAYFDEFFGQGGDYTEFVSVVELAKGAKEKMEKHEAGSQVTYGILVRVNRGALRDFLKVEKIIKD